VPQLILEDQLALHKLNIEIGELRGRGLVRKTYLEYPYYMQRSTIADEILQPDDRREFTSNQELFVTQTSAIFTIGYEGVSIDAYINTLLQNHIVVLVDVRNNTFSHKHGFSGSTFGTYVTGAGIEYVHLPSLGVPPQKRRSLASPEDYKDLFEYYRASVLPTANVAIEQVLSVLKAGRSVALTCFEANPEQCHRSELAICIQGRSPTGTPIINLHP
jgi:uncharacterized protein (DUF488 family)